MSTSRAAAILLAKELRLEFRTREILTRHGRVRAGRRRALQLCLRSHGRGIAPLRPRPALDRVSVCRLADAASFVRARASERHARRAAHGAGFALRDPAGQVLANFVFLSLAEVVLVPVFAVLYNVSLCGNRRPPDRSCWCWARSGLVTTGTVFSAISAHARMRELLLPLLLAADSCAAADRRRGSDRSLVRRAACAGPHLGRFPGWI